MSNYSKDEAIKELQKKLEQQEQKHKDFVEKALFEIEKLNIKVNPDCSEEDMEDADDIIKQLLKNLKAELESEVRK
jgi:hypothetical protein